MCWGYTLCVGGVYILCVYGVYNVYMGCTVCVCMCQVPEISITGTCSSPTRLAGWPVSPEIHQFPSSHDLIYKQIMLSFSHGFKRLN